MARADIMAGRAYVSLYTRNDQLTRGLMSAKTAMNKFGADIMQLGTRMMAVSAAMLAPIALATNRFAQFDDSMRAVNAVARGTQEDFQRLTDTAKRLGATTSFTAVQVSQLMIELGRAGFVAAEIDVMTESVMNLARATGTDAALSAGIVAASLRQFGMDAKEAARVANVLTLAANSTFNTIEGLGESLSYAGPVAKDLGLSFEETIAILGTLGNVGIQGSNAGTALRRLGVISAATGEKLHRIFGVSNVNLAGELKPLVQIMEEIGEATANLPVAERVAKMNEAFGLLGITSASVLSTTAVKTRELADSLRNAGDTAGVTARNMDAGLGGSLRILLSSIEGVELALGSALAPAMKSATDAANKAVVKLIEWIKTNDDLVIAATALAGGIGLLGASFVAVGIASKLAAFGIGVLSIGVGAIKTVFGIAVGAIRLFNAATIGLAGFLQAGFAIATAASTVAVTTLSGAQVAATAVTIPYAAITYTAATANAALGLAAYTATTGMIATTAAASAATTANVALIGSSVGASAGLVTIAASATTATAGTAAFTASGFAMAAAWTAISGVMAVAWGVIMGPLTPFILAAGAIVAAFAAIGVAAAVATVRGMDFSEAWRLGGDTLVKMFGILKQFGGLLKETLAGGDYDLAWRATVAAIRLTLAEGLDAMGKAWRLFWTFALTHAATFLSKFASMMIETFTIAAEAVIDPQRAVEKLGGLLNSLQNVNIGFNIDTDGMRAAANEEIAKIEAELAARKKRREAEAANGDAAAPGGQGGAGGGGGNGVPFGNGVVAEDGEEAIADEAATDAAIAKRDAARRTLDHIRDFADADYENLGATAEASAMVAKREKASIEAARRRGQITGDEATAAKAEADIRKAERDHQRKLAAFRNDGEVNGQQVGIKSGGASAATFSAQSLIAMGSAAGQGPQLKALIETKNAIAAQTKQQKEQSDAQIAAIKKSKMKHA